MSDQNTQTVLGQNINSTSSGGADNSPTGNNDSTQKDNQQTSDNGDAAGNTSGGAEDYLSEYVGEGKPYATVEDAAKALAKKAKHADTFIETLKTEKQELEEKISGSRKVDEILELLNNRKQGDTKQTDNGDNQTGGKSDGGNTQEDIRSAVETLLAEREKADAEKAEAELIKTNQEKAWELLTASFETIENAKLAVKNYINGSTQREDIVNRLGSYSPEDLVHLLGGKKPESNNNRKMPNSTPGSKLTVGEEQIFNSTNKLTWSKAKEIKKNDPKLYASHKFQNMMHNESATNANFFNE